MGYGVASIVQGLCSGDQEVNDYRCCLSNIVPVTNRKGNITQKSDAKQFVT